MGWNVFCKENFLKENTAENGYVDWCRTDEGTFFGDCFYVLHVERDDFLLISYDMKNDFQEIETKKY